MHYATSRKVLGSIPGDVTGEFSVTSENTMCPGSTQPLKMGTRMLFGVKTAGADNLPTSSADVTESGRLNFSEPSGPHRPVMGMLYLYLLRTCAVRYLKF
jgi:hypothetical protein